MSSPANEQASLPSWSPYPMEVAANAVTSGAAADIGAGAGAGRAGNRSAAHFGGAAGAQVE